MISLARYFIAVFAITWTCWFAAAGYADPYLSYPLGHSIKSILFYLGVFAPGIAAVVATLWADGWNGTRALLLRLVQWRTAWQWYAFALLYMVVIKLVAGVVFRLVLGRWPAFGHESLLVMFAAAIASVLLAGQAGEELGWRGYALPRFSAKVGLAAASVLLGMIWALWHLPLFFVFPQADTHGQSFPLYLAQVTALSVAISWLWWRTGGSLLLTMLFHAAVNNLKDIVPSMSAGGTSVFSLAGSMVGWITVALLWIAASWFLVQMGSRGGKYIPGLVQPATRDA